MIIRATGIFGAAAAVMVSGCVTVRSHTDLNYFESANDSFRKAEKSKDTAVADPEITERLNRLWADSPEVMRWMVEDHDFVRSPRLIGMKAPDYPLLPWLAKTRARVVLSVMIGRDGKVADARVYESSDPRFNESALEAVREWTFLPAESQQGVEMAMMLLPMTFIPEGRRK